MKKIALVAALGLLGLATGVANAAVTATGSFNVNISLTSKCEINSTNAATGATVTDIGLSYTSFQTTNSTGSTNFNVRCTNGLTPVTVAISNASQTDSVLNLAYTLNLTNSATYASGTNASLTPTADGTNHAYYVHATIASGQSGTCATNTCDNSAATDKNHTVTITY